MAKISRPASFVFNEEIKKQYLYFWKIFKNAIINLMVWLVIFNLLAALLAVLFSRFSFASLMAAKASPVGLIIGLFLVWFGCFLVSFILSVKRNYHNRLYLNLGLTTGVIVTVSLVAGSQPVIVALIASFYLANFITINRLVKHRLSLFARFKPVEILRPVIRLSFVLLTLLISTIGWYQIDRGVSFSLSLITPSNLLQAAQPILPEVNRQLSLSIKKSWSSSSSTSPEQTKLVFSQILAEFSQQDLSRRIGFKPELIPLDKVIFQADGQIDVGPALEPLSSWLASQLNDLVNRWRLWLSVAIFILTLILLAPFAFVVNLLLLLALPLIFKLLFKSKILKKEVKQLPVEVIS